MSDVLLLEDLHVFERLYMSSAMTKCIHIYIPYIANQELSLYTSMNT
jgi:hypothetical protein